MGPAWSQGAPSPRTEVVQATLPSKVELFDIAADSAETTNVAEKNRRWSPR